MRAYSAAKTLATRIFAPLLIFWRGLNTPSDFARDWYGELTNQMSHTLLGIFAAQLFVDVWFLSSGAMPYRSVVFAVVFLPYAVVIEGLVQRLRPGDAWFDSAMFGLGAAGTLVPVLELSAEGRTSVLEYDPAVRLGIFAFWVVLLSARVWKRLRADAE